MLPYFKEDKDKTNYKPLATEQPKFYFVNKLCPLNVQAIFKIPNLIIQLVKLNIYLPTFSTRNFEKRENKQRGTQAQFIQ